MNAALWGPLVGVVVVFGTWWLGLALPACAVAGLAGLCAVWWTTEPVPIAATSLLPFVVLPAVGALSPDDAGAAFGHPLILLLLAGFLLSQVMERSGAHERLAIAVIRSLGARTGRRSVLAFLLASALLSMWISNTATALMLLPVALAVIDRSSAPGILGAPLLLAMAWGASIGGMGTPVGTPPNPLLLAELKRLGQPWGFPEFLRVGVPIIAVLLPLTWGWLCREPALADVVVEVPPSRTWTSPERRAVGLFAVVIVLWVTRTAPFGGWATALGLDQVKDHTVGLLMVVVAFLTPDGTGRPLLDWPTAARIPWHLLLLFSGGIALGMGFRNTGLDVVLANQLGGLGSLPLPVSILVIAGTVTLCTELLSNTATAALLLPILATAAEPDAAVPWLASATFAASCAFMMPVATAPNAIVIGSGRLSPRRMAVEGLGMNVIAPVVIAAVCWALTA